MRIFFVSFMNIRNFYLASSFFICSQFAFSQQNVWCKILDKSHLTIIGTTNIIGFKLEQDAKNFLEDNFVFSLSINENRICVSKNEISIPIDKFRSENPFALRDFRKLVKNDLFPDLKIKLNFIETQSEKLKSEQTTGKMNVKITIAGQSKTMFIPLTSKRSDKTLKISGEKMLDIRDFGLEPPQQYFSIIKVNELIKISFNFYLNYEILV